MSPQPRPTAPSPSDVAARLAAERARLPFLLYRDGDGAQQIVTLATASRASIGRGRSNTVPLSWNVQVSRLHAELEYIGDDWTITDDGLSRNGTFVNGERVQGRRRLGDGDCIVIGGTVIGFCWPHDRGRSRTQLVPDMQPPKLTDAQRRVLVALCRPFADNATFAVPATNRQIAEELFLSVDAVKTHLRTLSEKLAVSGLAQNAKRARLIERAFELGLVTSRDLAPPRDA